MKIKITEGDNTNIIFIVIAHMGSLIRKAAQRPDAARRIDRKMVADIGPSPPFGWRCRVKHENGLQIYLNGARFA